MMMMRVRGLFWFALCSLSSAHLGDIECANQELQRSCDALLQELVSRILEVDPALVFC